MKFHSQDIPGLFLIENFTSKDERGIFVKTYHAEKFAEIGFQGSFKESYYSQSVKNVVRGMHFQSPPHDHEKLTYVTQGEILDVILDLRKDSVTYQKFAAIKLKEFGDAMFIPKGCAHGFLTLSDTATVVYNVTTVYNQIADAGILWNSFGFDWQLSGDPIISERDKSFLPFVAFKSPF